MQIISVNVAVYLYSCFRREVYQIDIDNLLYLYMVASCEIMFMKKDETKHNAMKRLLYSPFNKCRQPPCISM